MKITRIEVDTIPERCADCVFLIHPYGDSSLSVCAAINPQGNYGDKSVVANPDDAYYRRSDCPLCTIRTSTFRSTVYFGDDYNKCATATSSPVTT